MLKVNEKSFISEFLEKETSGGILLISAAFLSLLFANTGLSFLYTNLLELPFKIQIGSFEIAKPLLLWVNDGLMAVFFFLIGLELKREILEGELSDKKQIILPGFAAFGGMLIPSAIYVFFNYKNPDLLNGWAIPAATDIAFALGVLSLLGKNLPGSFKIFLTSLAIFDDLGAILIIAFFYTANISFTALLIASVCIVILIILNKKGVDSKSIYLFIGLIMWVAFLKSGVHATLAGVVLAMFIPLKPGNPDEESPLKSLEHDLHPMVVFLIIPIFAFFNSGIDLRGFEPGYILHPVPLGIALGLFVGKQTGVFFFSWLAIKLKLSDFPTGMDYKSLYGIAVICGIGFTMSLFIGSLAFEQTGSIKLFDERIGILAGSLLSAVAGYMLLKNWLKKRLNI